MRTLLDTSSPKYFRRLVREVNSAMRSGQSVYGIDAITGHKFKVWEVCLGRGALMANGTRYSIRFFDGNGNEIVASRE